MPPDLPLGPAGPAPPGPSGRRVDRHHIGLGLFDEPLDVLDRDTPLRGDRLRGAVQQNEVESLAHPDVDAQRAHGDG
jgi:hypothetical protein